MLDRVQFFQAYNISGSVIYVPRQFATLVKKHIIRSLLEKGLTAQGPPHNEPIFEVGEMDL